MSKRNLSAIVLAISLMMIVSGCKKPAPPPPPPPPPPPVKEAPPPQPRVTTFVAEPSTIERGQASTLRWNVSDATEVSIDQGIGTVQASGTRKVFPSSNTTYTLTAKGAGGTATGTASVTVTQPPPPPPPPPPPAPTKSVSERLAEEVHDAYFDYDKYDIRADAQPVLTSDATALKSILNAFPNAVISIEGHCDERGSAEYNLGLGDRRATSAKEFLVQLGVPEARLRTISYGKERPQCTESTEACWQLNRRVHFTAGQ